MSIQGGAAHSEDARQVAVEDVSRKDDEHCRRVLAARAAEWVKGGRGSSHLLEADELHVVRRWLGDERARDPGVSEQIHSLVASSEAVLAAQVEHFKKADAQYETRVEHGLAILRIAEPRHAVAK